MREEFDELRTENKYKIDKVKRMLKDINDENKNLEEGSSNLRIRENQVW